MAKKEFAFRGKSLQELKAMSSNEFMALIPANERRHLKKGLTDVEKKVLNKIRKGKSNIETHAREMVMVPEMVGTTLKVYNGKEFILITITEEMLGHRLGEFALTRKNVRHGAAGIGATRSSSSQAVH